MYDAIFNIHYITQVCTKSPLFSQIYDHPCLNVWIVAIIPEETIMSYSNLYELLRNQNIYHSITIYISITWKNQFFQSSGDPGRI